MSIRPRSFQLALLALAASAIALAMPPERAAASASWELILDVPSARFSGIDFPTPDEGWLVAGGGLLHSTDGGTTWTEQAQLSGTDVDFYDAAHGWLVGISGAIFGTSDGGTTWQEQTSGTDVHLGDVVAVGSQEAWVVGSHRGFSDAITFPIPTVLLHTVDGGTTWQHAELPGGSWFRQLEFVGERGWLLGTLCSPPTDEPICPELTASGMLHTIDGGATWHFVESDVPPGILDIAFSDSSNGWLVAEGNGSRDRSLYRTSDGGRSWERVSIGSGLSADSVEIEDAERVWVAGNVNDGTDDLEVRHTEDGGASWTTTGRIATGVWFEYLGRFAVRGGKLFITGGALATRSLDGTTWERLDTPALAPHSMHFVSANTGFAISSGSLIRSDDGGLTWRPIGQFGEFREIAFLDAETGVAWMRCFEACGGEIHLTTDGGVTWKRVYRAPRSVSFDASFRFADNLHGWLVANRRLLATEDGGKTWQERPIPDAEDDRTRIAAAGVLAAGRGWLITDNIVEPRHLFLTIDGGESWTVASVGDGVEPTRASFVDEDHGWVTSGTCDDVCKVDLYATSDAGRTWLRVNEWVHPEHLRAITFADTLNGWAIGTFPCGTPCILQIGYTADGGRTWEAQLDDVPARGDLVVLGADHAWFLADPDREVGIGGGPASRTLLYRFADEAAGTPIKFPDVGYGGTGGGAEVATLAALLALLGVSLALGALRLRR